jgi:hypothetical protein
MGLGEPQSRSGHGDEDKKHCPCRASNRGLESKSIFKQPKKQNKIVFEMQT